MSGWWSEHFADFAMVLSPGIEADTQSISTALVELSLSPSFSMEAVGTSVADFAVTLASELSFAGIAYKDVFDLDLTPSLAMEAVGTSAADFAVTLTPTVGMTGAEHYPAAFDLSLTITIGQSAAIKQLPHAIPWTL